mgnify:CR=1 FL=1
MMLDYNIKSTRKLVFLNFTLNKYGDIYGDILNINLLIWLYKLIKNNKTVKIIEEVIKC